MMVVGIRPYECAGIYCRCNALRSPGPSKHSGLGARERPYVMMPRLSSVTSLLLFLGVFMTNFSEVSSGVSNHNKRHGCNRTDLEFTHIPKNAGTSIENAGKKAGICWGRFSLFHNRKMCSTWHQPPRINKDLHQGKKTFCVIRDPKERIVSEYRYRWAKKHGNNPRTTTRSQRVHPGQATAQ